MALAKTRLASRNVLNNRFNLTPSPTQLYPRLHNATAISSTEIPSSPSLDLPPLQKPSILKSSGGPLLLEPDASKRNGKPTPNSKLAPPHSRLMTPIDDEDVTRNEAHQKLESAVPVLADRALGSSSPQSLRKILDDENNIPSKKRHIVENNKDDFVQLPQPPKKQKAAKQVVPPIIIGLFEPPPQAALFPPIASSSFHDSHGRNSLNTVALKVNEFNETSPNGLSKAIEKGERTPTKDNKKKKDLRARKKWTEEETNQLLLGVHKFGVGNWTDILDDPAFAFNDRSGADLKDRFRTCCPAELWGVSNPAREVDKKSKSSLMSENILIKEDNSSVFSKNAAASTNTPRKSRAHRKKLEDLALLGIEGPFRKSRRRERRPFSETDDREILEGYEAHGATWTKIQRDPRFHLQSRQPTDLRDRFRNKYPEKFSATDKGKENLGVNSSQSSNTQQSEGNVKDKTPSASRASSSLGQNGEAGGKEPSTKEHTSGMCSSGSLQPSSSREALRIQEIISTQEPYKPQVFQPQTTLYNFKDNFGFSDQHVMESADNMPFAQSFDWSGTITGEMDISRLLLDESWPSEMATGNGKEKQSFTDPNSILTSTADHGTVGPNFYNLLGDSDNIVDM